MKIQINDTDTHKHFMYKMLKKIEITKWLAMWCNTFVKIPIK